MNRNHKLKYDTEQKIRKYDSSGNLRMTVAAPVFTKKKQWHMPEELATKKQRYRKKNGKNTMPIHALVFG